MKFKIIILIIFIFLLGMVTGGAITVLMVKSKIRNMASSPMEELVISRANELNRELNLSDSQYTAVETILADSVADLEEFRSTVRRSFFEIFKNQKSEIVEELDLQQQEKFERIARKRLQMWGLEDDSVFDHSPAEEISTQ